jgi:ubiquinone/menaquinone biosynthesis C-methylase UbiE
MKPSSLRNVCNMYEANADSYSEMMDKEIELPVYKDVLGRLHKNIANIPGPLLDTACGSGHMLAMFRSQYDASRSLVGIDISPRMVAISKDRIGMDGLVKVGDMRSLPDIDSGSVAAVINFFAVHHLDIDGIREAMHEWNRVLVHKGRLLLATWEGSGIIDYGEESDIVALKYTCQELIEIAELTRFMVTQCTVKPVDDFPMDAIYLECMKE